MAGDVVSGARRRRERLRASMDALERSIAAPSPGRPRDWAAGVDAVLAELTAVFDEHVAETEEDGGLLERVVTDAPRLARAVEVLHEDHDRIATAVIELRDVVRGVDGAAGVEAVRSGALDLLGALARHRHRGADLLYEAYSVDVGTGD